MKLFKYRPEIDGLRTLAILAVLIYHADFSIGKQQLLQGGFLGVDIFFVISGFLITSLITKEIDLTGKFSFSNFYERRTRRLLPVLIFVMILSFPFAWAYLLPAHFVDFANSIIASNMFLSNFYWYHSLQVYGAEAGNLKPFLHTWSLSVEEQYYLFFPIILLAIIRWLKQHTIATLTILTLSSFQIAEVMSAIDPSLSFYLLISRFWELLIGSLLAYTLHLHPAKDNDTLLTKTMPSVGLYLILYSIIFVNLDYNHPGFITLLPVFG
ncbi:acyltransferase family protein, partial [Campylobacterota bacterium]